MSTNELVDALKDEIAADVLARVRAELDAEDGFLDVKGAAEFLSAPPGRVYKLKAQGALPFRMDGGRLLFARSDLRAYVLAGGAKLR
jgi:excisionase family DNA binding protein